MICRMSRKWTFTVILFIIGFMLAIQFQTTKEPTVRDTRDVRELRSHLNQERERHQQLVKEIEKTQSLLHQYEATIESREDDIVDVLEQQIEELRVQAGLSEASGKGVRITIDSLYSDQFFGQERRTPSPELFRFLVNELNIFGAKNIAIGNERIISTSAFRDVSGITYLNFKRLPPLPIEMKVLSDRAERLHNELLVSNSIEEFEIGGFTLTFELEDELVLPAYEQTPRVRFMEEMKEG